MFQTFILLLIAFTLKWKICNKFLVFFYIKQEKQLIFIICSSITCIILIVNKIFTFIWQWTHYSHTEKKQLQTIFCMLAAVGRTRLRSLLCCATIRERSLSPNPVKNTTQLCAAVMTKNCCHIYGMFEFTSGWSCLLQACLLKTVHLVHQPQIIHSSLLTQIMFKTKWFPHNVFYAYNITLNYKTFLNEYVNKL